MTLEEAKALLETCTREELRDSSFGDCEVHWMKDDKEIANGYFGNECADVNFPSKFTTESFFADEARALRNLGKLTIDALVCLND